MEQVAEPQQPKYKNNWFFRHKIITCFSVIALLFLSIGLFNYTNRPAQTTQTVQTSDTPSEDTSSTPSTEPFISTSITSAVSEGFKITGFGATITDWNSTHTPDSDLSPGSGYDRMVNGKAEYAEVSPNNGRVISYIMNLPDEPNNIGDAKIKAEGQLPPDASIIKDRVLPGCEMIQFQSQTLKSALSSSFPENNGLVDVEFENENTPDKYNPQDVTDLLFSIGVTGITGGC